MAQVCAGLGNGLKRMSWLWFEYRIRARSVWWLLFTSAWCFVDQLLHPRVQCARTYELVEWHFSTPERFAWLGGWLEASLRVNLVLCRSVVARMRTS
jgi:hypothetical protein